jgi:hypothetical protein
MNRLLTTILLVLSLTACADRTRYNCEDTPNNGIFERRCD